jgi:hypothetical protein
MQAPHLRSKSNLRRVLTTSVSSGLQAGSAPGEGAVARDLAEFVMEVIRLNPDLVRQALESDRARAQSAPIRVEPEQEA